jgi:S1-C subfamily serine protease/mono/diheme cytochrome c family protein
MGFLAVLLSVVAVAPPAAQADPALEPERIVFMLQYVGADYGLAVSEGRVANPFEYDELVRFGRVLADSAELLRARGAPEEVGVELRRLERSIKQMKPWPEVRAITDRVAATLVERFKLVAFPSRAADPERGAELYATLCVTCHGTTGGGDGPAAAEQDPRPWSFRDRRINVVSPHQIFGALRFGVEGTAMASYADVLSAEQSWDLAFYVLTLREDFAPSAARPGFDVPFEDLLLGSNDAILTSLRAAHEQAGQDDVDWFRLHPPQPRPTLPAAGGAVSGAASSGALDESDGLGLAMRLQDAFAAVAERVLPSVVNVSSFERVGSVSAAKAPAAPASSTPGQAWTIAGSETPTYPGFRRIESGSGFFVGADGYLLTAHHVVTREGGEPAEVIDVELPDGRRVLSRLVGAEPALDLAVVKLEVVSEQRPPVVKPIEVGDGEALRVGYWTIAVGDPWGPERTYAVGTLAARAERQCYQEQLTATLLQASLVVNPESFGGPLVDIRGRVVGMLVPPPLASTQGTTYALPIDLALNLYEALKVTESRRSPWLGVSVLELATARRRASSDSPRIDLPSTGVYIDDVFEPSPASRAGIRVGDSLVAIDGQRLLSVLDFQKWLYLAGIGHEVSLELHRAGETLVKRVQVEERPASATTR